MGYLSDDARARLRELTAHLIWNPIVGTSQCTDTGFLLKECHCAKCARARQAVAR